MLFYNHQDSSDLHSFTEIFPDRLFNYSVNEGFVSVARRVGINERLKACSKGRDSTRITGTNNQVSVITESEQQFNQPRLKDKTVKAPNYIIWYLGGLVLVFAAVFVFRWKLND